MSRLIALVLVALACGGAYGAGLRDGMADGYAEGVTRSLVALRAAHLRGVLSCWCVRGCPSCGWTHPDVTR